MAFKFLAVLLLSSYLLAASAQTDGSTVAGGTAEATAAPGGTDGSTASTNETTAGNTDEPMTNATDSPTAEPTSAPESLVQVECTATSMTVYLNKSDFADGTVASDFRFLDEDCIGFDHIDDEVAISTKYDECETSSEASNVSIIYMNTVIYTMSTPGDGLITRVPENMTLSVECELAREQMVQNAFDPIAPVVHISEQSYGNFTIAFERYTDSSYSEVAEQEEVALKEEMFFGINLTAADGLTVFAQNCWSTPEMEPLGDDRYDLIDSGCAEDDTLEMDENMSSDSFSAFSFDAFTYRDGPSEVYLHCEVLVCFSDDDESRCAQGCHDSRRRRSAQKGQSSSPHLVTQGPFIISKESHMQDSPVTSYSLPAVFAATCAVCMLAGAVLAVVVVKFRRRDEKVIA